MDVFIENELYFEAISLCIANDSTGMWRWTRVADIVNGELIEHAFSGDKSGSFNEKYYAYQNRQTLPSYNDEPQKGDFAVFSWADMPNRKVPDKVYTDIKENIRQLPIQVITLNADTAAQAVSMLHNGVREGNSQCSVMYLIGAVSSAQQGLLCTPNDMEFRNNTYRLKPSVPKLPCFNIEQDDVISLRGVRRYPELASSQFLRKMDPGLPDGYVQTREILDILKEAILHNRAMTLNSFREFVTTADGTRTYTKRELRTFKEFLHHVSDKPLYEEISNDIGCTIEAAHGYVENFIANANQYLDGSELDSELLTRLVMANDALRERFTALVEEKWRQTEKEKIAQTQLQLDTLERKCESRTNDLKSTNLKIESSEKRLSELQETILKNEVIARESYRYIQEKLTDARADISEFLANISVYLPTQLGALPIAENVAAPVQYGEPLECEKVDVWQSIVDTLEDNLGMAGLAKEHRHLFAHFLYSTYLHRTPLLLAGPNAEEIAHALSASVSGKFADVLVCEDHYSCQTATEALRGDGGILIVRNPFCSDWIQNLLQEMKQSHRMVVFCYPFTEDLAVEPASLYQYLLPVFTGDLVDKEAVQDTFIGTTLADFGETFVSSKKFAIRSELLENLGVGRIMSRNVQAIIADAQSMDSADNTGRDVLIYEYVLLPYAAATGRGKQLCSQIQDSSAVPQDIKTYIYHYFDYGEE